MMVRRIGQGLIVLGAGIGVAVAVAMATHIGVQGVPWLVNVALAKLGLVSAAGLMAGGAVSIRLANRAEQRRLNSGKR